jgi:16S rRNA (cytosine967-C5)-methyltransferase
VTSSPDARAASVRSLAATILVKVDTRNSYADILVDRALRTADLDQRDRALLTELTYGTLRWRGTIDARLERYLNRPLARTDPLIRNLLRLASYQLLYLDRVPGYAAVNEAVELAKRHGGRTAAGFVNGVLRSLVRDVSRGAAFDEEKSAVALAVKHSHPEWLVRRWLDEFGPREAQALMQANNEKPTLTVRVNTLRCTRDDLLTRFTSAGIAAAATPRSPVGIALRSAGIVEQLLGFDDGLFQVQGEASQLVSYLLAPEPGERILDACAAPGGKTTQIAELMKDRGEVVALDRSAPGVEKICANVNRLGLKSVRAVVGDATQPLAASIAAHYDRILIDAPCSGLGTLRGHPEIKWHRDPKDIQRLSRLQTKIVDRTARYLKPGGVLVYSTCTLSREENEGNIAAFLARHCEFELEDAAGYLPPQAKRMVHGLFFQALPQRDNTDGFFAARLTRIR